MCDKKDKITPEEVNDLLKEVGLNDRVNKYEIFIVERDSTNEENDR